jgi:hypothetical protein
MSPANKKDNGHMAKGRLEVLMKEADRLIRLSGQCANDTE